MSNDDIREDELKELRNEDGNGVVAIEGEKENFAKYMAERGRDEMREFFKEKERERKLTGWRRIMNNIGKVLWN